MKNLIFHADYEDYKEYVFSMFKDKDLADHPFYRNLILFVCDHRSPIFYDISDGDEHFAFSGAYHFITRRLYADKEGSETRQSIFFLHDFTHLLFPYPHDVSRVSIDEFTEQFIYQERIASTETEVMSYYRVPGLRDKVFSDERILFDCLGGERPDPVEFLRHRNRLINDDEYGQKHLGDHPEVLEWMRSWRRLTPRWCQQRYASMTGVRVPTYDWLRLSVENYEDVITHYHHLPSQERYERNILRNISIAYALLGYDDAPTDFDDIAAAFDRLDGRVILR